MRKQLKADREGELVIATEKLIFLLGLAALTNIPVQRQFQALAREAQEKYEAGITGLLELKRG